MKITKGSWQKTTKGVLRARTRAMCCGTQGDLLGRPARRNVAPYLWRCPKCKTVRARIGRKWRVCDMIPMEGLKESRG